MRRNFGVLAIAISAATFGAATVCPASSSPIIMDTLGIDTIDNSDAMWTDAHGDLIVTPP
jgi:hypothetical protein